MNIPVPATTEGEGRRGEGKHDYAKRPDFNRLPWFEIACCLPGVKCVGGCNVSFLASRDKAWPAVGFVFGLKYAWTRESRGHGLARSSKQITGATRFESLADARKFDVCDAGRDETRSKSSARLYAILRDLKSYSLPSCRTCNGTPVYDWVLWAGVG